MDFLFDTCNALEESGNSSDAALCLEKYHASPRPCNDFFTRYITFCFNDLSTGERNRTLFAWYCCSSVPLALSFGSECATGVTPGDPARPTLCDPAEEDVACWWVVPRDPLLQGGP